MNQAYIDAATTLQQCTLGPSQADIHHYLQADGLENWIAQQASLPPSSWLQIFKQDELSTPNLGHRLYFASSWTKMTTEGQDILRQRIAYTLSQLFVVSVKDPAFKNASKRQYMCQYFDGFMKHAFANFRDVIRFVSTSPIMGEYLTLVNNVANATTAPDENYARELLQLFTLGPVRLDNNGDVQRDSNGNDIPSYTQEDIEQLARVFTGWKFINIRGDEKYAHPMQARGTHDTGEKRILGTTFPAGVDAKSELNSVIELLMQQDTLYTFVSKFFINKWVKSNPNGEYVQRVRDAFQQSNGDIQTLVTAILTDPHARTANTYAGKLRDPICVFTHAMRALQLQRREGVAMWSKQFARYGRMLPLSAPSVFYYYQPDDAPSHVDFNGLSAPEFNVYQWHDVYQYGNQFKELIIRVSEEGKSWHMDPALFHLYLEFQDEAVVDYLNQHLFAYQMNQTSRQHYLNYLAQCTVRKSTRRQELKHLVMNALLSPEFVTQG
ncbi:DUF1800 family protein [Vibrio sagamiensis]|uniref:DUF1800 domain-containing protein n=1 Tax=Vibrio sagamiensis NBRC 104589 TaxID=1219064 RepID=A0A511QDF7_9VIBR|nr:DUF1800 family protein [Vibrio sagamiensis]PNQ64261.1 DUF1800 domain-containing protein [Vibrio agarivorans]GEM75338.1 hypothetical protein VSA01S_14500 [Vibrio sagamiensis NBRC 104589]